jgi:alkylation response protein AidB-like acyl-CoA dehydrogenase
MTATERARDIGIELSDEQIQLVELASEFARREIRPIAADVDEHGEASVPWELLEKAQAAGLTTYTLPEEVGGGGVRDCFTECLVTEELSFGDSSLSALVTSPGFFAETILALGTHEQQERFLAPLCVDGRPPLTALATTEPGFGSDAAGMQTVARRVDGGYRLSGQKTWVSNGGVSEWYLVFAQTRPGSRRKGITAFVLHRDDAGLSTGAPMRKLGDRGIINAELFLDDVFVPEDRRIGEEGKGFYGLMGTFDRSRITLAAHCVGLARAATEYAIAYARERTQFGRPIIEHQAVGFRLADMQTRVDAARLLAWRAARRHDQGLRTASESAMAKLYASEAAMFCAWGAVQTLGGWGYSREYPVEKWFRDAKLEEIWEGTSDIQRLVIARHLQRGEH